MRGILGSGLYLVVFDMLFASSNASMDVPQYSTFGGSGASLIGFLLAIFWKGIGEMVALPFVVGPRCTSLAAGMRWRIGLVTHQVYRPDERQDANEAATPYPDLRNRL